MNARERLIRALHGEPNERPCWAPNVAYWWPQHPEYQAGGEVTFLESIGADPLIRGHYPMEDGNWDHLCLFRETYRHSTFTETIKGNEKYEVYETPVGSLTFRYVLSPEGGTWFLIDHGVVDEEDFKTLTYLKEDTILVSNYDRYYKAMELYGERCLMVPLIATQKKSSFQAMIEYWVGTEEMAYAMADYPETIETTLAAMMEVNREAVRISAQVGAPAYLTWEDSSTTNISPDWYAKYICPEIDEWCDILHEHDGMYMQHACGHLQHLIPVMSQSKIDVIESISPPPTGNIELWDAAEMLPEHIVLIGGIEPTCFAALRGSEFERYVEKLIHKMKGKRFILANSDSCPPEVPMENYQIVRHILDK